MSTRQAQIERQKQVRELSRAGHTPREMARIVGCAVSTVQRDLEALRRRGGALPRPLIRIPSRGDYPPPSDWPLSRKGPRILPKDDDAS